MRTPRPPRSALALAALGGLAIAAGARAVPLARRTLQEARRVPPELRSPVMLVPVPAGLGAALQSLTAPFPQPESEGASWATIPGVDGLDDLRVVVHDHATGPGAPAVVWFHGGGHVTGSPLQDLARNAALARDLGGVVIGVEYRLAPRHPFPAALDDALRALRWVHEHADRLGIDPRRIAVGGDSAGGGLAAAAAQRAHDEGVPVCFQALLYPMLDDRTVARAEANGEWSLLWTPPANRYGWTSYLGHPPGPEPAPYAAPARRTDLAGLAPAWIGVGTLDLFHDEDVDYAERLAAAGVPVDLVVVDGMWHAADMVVDSPTMAQFRSSMTDALRHGTDSRTDPRGVSAATDVTG